MSNFGGSITLVSVADGEASDNYRVHTNISQINRFSSGDNDIVFSPSGLTYTLSKIADGGETYLSPYDPSDSSTVGEGYFNECISIIQENEVTHLDAFDNLLNFLNNVICVKTVSGATVEVTALSEIRSIETVVVDTDLSYKQVRINFSTLFNLTVKSTDIHKEEFNNLIDFLKHENHALDIALYTPAINTTPWSPLIASFVTEKAIIVQNGTTESMLHFSVDAAKIKAGIDNSALTFSADGLVVQNSGLEIISYEPVYTVFSGSTFATGVTYYERATDGTYYTTSDTTPQSGKTYYYISSYSTETLLGYNNGQLQIKGNGSFTGDITATSGTFNGTVYATAGSFQGTIEAQSGHIGGFNIGTNTISSTDGSIQLINDTSSSKIIADNIELGTGAVITDYLQLGNSYIYNPSLHDGSFITVANSDGTSNYIKITNNGYANFGDIVLDGVNSIITGTNFTIAPNRSVFSNVEVNGTIHTGVFETGHTQDVGGAMLFRESAEIESIEGVSVNTRYKNTFILSTKTNLNLRIGSIVELSNDSNISCYAQVEDITVTSVNSEDIIQYSLTSAELLPNKNLSIITQIADVNNRFYVSENSQSAYNTYYTVKETEYYQTDASISTFDSDKYYYELSGSEYVKTTASGPESGHTYYEKSEIHYVITDDTTKSASKDYYELQNNIYIVTSDTTLSASKTYYERIYGIRCDFIVFTGSTFISGITYYEYDDGYYVPTTDTTKQSGKTYYYIEADFYNEYINNLLLGINSQGSDMHNLKPYSITFSELLSVNFDDYSVIYSTPKLLLGNLSSLNNSNITGYGLYGQNVYLTGSLTTEVNDNSYAGVNTLDGVNAIKFNDVSSTDTSRIVFWAGAQDTTKASIQNACFQVTEAGSLYAAQGLFEGSIITNSKIEASDLYAIRLFGGKEKQSSPLNIYDTDSSVGGIVFRKRDKYVATSDTYFHDNKDYFTRSSTEPYVYTKVTGNYVSGVTYYEYATISSSNEGTETLRLSTTGFILNNSDTFIDFSDGNITFSGNSLLASTVKTNSSSSYLTLANSKISAYSAGEFDTSLGSLEWVNTDGDISYTLSIDTLNQINQNKDKISLISELVDLQKDVEFGGTLAYKKVENGYNLFIS